MSTDLLRRAAAALREHAGYRASSPPWVAHPDGLVWGTHVGDPVSASTEPEDAEYIALVHPPVALALAGLLDSEAEAWEIYGTPRTGIVALAQAVLREDQ